MKTGQNLILICLFGAVLSTTTRCWSQTTVTKIAAGNGHSLFVKSDGSLWGMGFNQFGELGNVVTNFSTFQPTLLISNSVTAVAACEFQSYYQTSSSSLWAMGQNQFGQLGDGTTNNILVPKLITTGFSLALGAYHTLFVRGGPTSTRDFDAMGNNQYGELGDGTTNSQSAPERIERDSTIVGGVYYVTAAACGDHHSLFLKSDTSLWAMGFNSDGALGDTTYNSTNRGEKIVTSGVTAVAAAGDHSLFIKTDGSLWGMGNNNFGQLGNQISGNSNKPVEIVSNSVTAVASGLFHTLYIETDGSLWGVGRNEVGQLGDGTYNDTNKPERIVAGGVTAIAAGDYHSLFLTSDGSLWGMGYNQYGQLGNIPSGTQPVPIQIVGPIVWNGGFETHDFLGWAHTEGSIATAASYAHSGACGVQIGPVGHTSFLSQILTTLPGTNYLVSFWLNCDGQTPNQFTVSWRATTLLNVTNLAATGWTNMQFTIKATDTNALLQFGFRNDPSYFGFDDVSVVPVSPPVITSVTPAGTNLVLNATNGLWSGTYVTLTSTNITTPRSLWTPIATNTLNGSGNFTITATNAIKVSDQKRFFVLELQ